MGYRYVRLTNAGAYAARMQLSWSAIVNGQTVTGKYEQSGYHDILTPNSRTIDMQEQAHIPEGATVRLNCFVVAGRDKSVLFTYSCEPGSTISFQCDGTTLFNSLKQI
ncbi:hypothetical protein [Bifidobacterium sp.]|uniref:hypothetical protein n=1 Tax=Bifidobacterium sp. TaxID=41200 RepID=UPI0039E7828F